MGELNTKRSRWAELITSEVTGIFLLEAGRNHLLNSRVGELSVNGTEAPISLSAIERGCRVVRGGWEARSKVLLCVPTSRH